MSELRVIDSSSRMLLVEAPEAALRAVVDDMPGWLVVPEQQIERPDPRRKARRPR